MNPMLLSSHDTLKHLDRGNVTRYESVLSYALFIPRVAHVEFCNINAFKCNGGTNDPRISTSAKFAN